MNLRDITKFFRFRTSSAFLDLAGRMLALVPAEYTLDALSLILRADIFLNKQKITDQELEELILCVSKKDPSCDAETLVSTALANARTIEKCLLCAERLSVVSMENKAAFAGHLLEFDKSFLPIRQGTEREFKLLASKLALRDKTTLDLLEHDAKRRATASKVLNSGAGVAVALIVLLLFLLAATFLRSLFFGIILAYLMLPVEKYFETKFFRSKQVVFLSRIFTVLLAPFAFLKNKVKKTKVPTRQEYVKAERKSLILKSSFATLLSLLFMVFFVLILLAALLVPTAVNIGNDLKSVLSSSSAMTKLEKQLEYYVQPEGEKKEIQKKNDQKDDQKEEKKTLSSSQKTPAPASLTELLRKMRPILKDYASKYKNELTRLAFTQGKGVVAAVFSIAAFVGKFLFDLLLMVFFFLYFLQQMAFYTNSVKGGKKQNKKLESVGTWAVKGIFESSWLPAVSKDTKEEAVKIIDTICNMFRCWAKGYLSIIVIEAPLYIILFSLLSVPYGVILGMISSTTVLLPVLGLAGCITLTVCTCIAFCEVHLATTLVGVMFVYLVVNGILEQLILYPNLVGGSIGLSILETIIVVLLGGLFAGIPGMIFAVPAAAVIKYLIPRIYNIWSSPQKGKKT